MKTIAVDELRVGMYIHLEGGWLSHPFPLSSFRIATPEQISTLRGLGLTRVQWVPDKSDAGTFAAAVIPAGAGDAAAAPVPPAAPLPGASSASGLFGSGTPASFRPFSSIFSQ